MSVISETVRRRHYRKAPTQLVPHAVKGDLAPNPYSLDVTTEKISRKMVSREHSISLVSSSAFRVPALSGEPSLSREPSLQAGSSAVAGSSCRATPRPDSSSRDRAIEVGDICPALRVIG